MIPAEMILEAEPVSTDSPATAPIASARPTRTQWLQDRFTFDTFVKGPSNEFALAVARRVASWADGHFNPVVFHGAYGFGKTHLLNAIAWEAMRTAPDRRVVYLTAERFLSLFVRALIERQGGGLQGRAALGRPAADRRRPLHRRQAVQRGRALPHSCSADGRRPPRGVLGRPAAGGALRDRRSAALAPLGRPRLRHRAGRPVAPARHPAAQGRAALPPARRRRPGAARSAAIPGRPLHRQRARAGRRAQHADRAGGGRRRRADAGRDAGVPRPDAARRRQARHRRRHPEGDGRVLSA